MSDDHGAGAPSFGDLFDDPDAPERAAAAPGDLVTGHDLDHESEEASHLVAGFEHDEPDADDDPAPADDGVPGHDLDHDSDEAAHLVAGFEHEEPDDEAPEPEPEPEPVAPAAAAGAAGVAASARSAAPWDGTVDPAISSAPAGRVDTGRLYRSAGAEGPHTLDAIPALDPARLAELEAAQDEAGAQAPAGAVAPTARTSTVGLTYSGVMVVVVAATVLVGFLEAVVRNEIGWLTGLTLLLASVYAAVFVRRADIWAAVVAPPLAFLVATLTAGQLTLGATGTLLEREGFMIFKTLAVNAPWILASTVISLVIVLVRRRRAPAPS